ncbi:MAG: hypothetical protein CL775_02955 [Chloroflexi bacterium]|nr:hypothetical protein [Chloroflexota bacterium]
MSYLSSFILINIFLGILVLSSYFVGITQFSEYSESLWGGVQGSLRKTFVISMLFGAVGYMIFFTFIIYSCLVEENYVKELYFYKSINLFGALNFSVIIFLISASIWMPTILMYLKFLNSIFWYVSVGSLVVTAFSAISILIFTAFGFLNITFNIKTSIFSFITLLGLLQVVSHCLILDGIIWVAKFSR